MSVFTSRCMSALATSTTAIGDVSAYSSHLHEHGVSKKLSLSWFAWYKLTSWKKNDIVNIDARYM